MGSPLSPILIADIVLDYLENKALESLRIDIPFYTRYVDDVAMAAPYNFINKVLDTFNSLHLRIKFTLEVGDKLNFLGITLIKNNSVIEFNWFHQFDIFGQVYQLPFSLSAITEKRYNN